MPGARRPAHEQPGVLAHPQAATARGEPGLHRLDHPGVLGVVRTLDRRDRRQVVDHVVGVAAVEPVTVPAPLDLAERTPDAQPGGELGVEPRLRVAP